MYLQCTTQNVHGLNFHQLLRIGGKFAKNFQLYYYIAGNI